ncbi:group-specific protein [Bacillus mycoides]|nr:group-specific protein [Bacillus mycoides]
MKNVHRWLNYFGFICVCMSSFGFVSRWIFRDVIALDQLLVLSIFNNSIFCKTL